MQSYTNHLFIIQHIQKYNFFPIKEQSKKKNL
nr:MAG TPA: hypothetical protein [Herelleviridae sp.]